MGGWFRLSIKKIIISLNIEHGQEVLHHELQGPKREELVWKRLRWEVALLMKTENYLPLMAYGRGHFLGENFERKRFVEKTHSARKILFGGDAHAAA